MRVPCGILIGYSNRYSKNCFAKNKSIEPWPVRRSMTIPFGPATPIRFGLSKIRGNGPEHFGPRAKSEPKNLHRARNGSPIRHLQTITSVNSLRVTNQSEDPWSVTKTFMLNAFIFESKWIMKLNYKWCNKWLDLQSFN